MSEHVHGPDGQMIPTDAPQAEADAATQVAETAAGAEVEIAKVNARRDVAVAEIGLQREQLWQEGRVAELEGEVRGMRKILDKIMPAPEPEGEPVVIEAPPEPVEQVAPAPEPDAGPPEPKKKSKGFWGDAYS